MAVVQLPSGPEVLMVEAEYPTAIPSILFEYWTEPALLKQWWPQEAEIQPYLGGNYHLSWPQMNWHLRGHYTSFEPAKLLGFTWKWDHDPQEMITREVKIAFEPSVTGGTRLLLTHGPYGDTLEEQEVRIEHHLAGWNHFLPRLKPHVAPSR